MSSRGEGADVKAKKKGVTTTNAKSGQLSAKLEAERKAARSPTARDDERMMVSPEMGGMGGRGAGVHGGHGADMQDRGQWN